MVRHLMKLQIVLGRYVQALLGMPRVIRNDESGASQDGAHSLNSLFLRAGVILKKGDG